MVTVELHGTSQQPFCGATVAPDVNFGRDENALNIFNERQILKFSFWSIIEKKLSENVVNQRS